MKFKSLVVAVVGAATVVASAVANQPRRADVFSLRVRRGSITAAARSISQLDTSRPGAVSFTAGADGRPREACWATSLRAQMSGVSV